jgi:hypothetical protein
MREIGGTLAVALLGAGLGVPARADDLLARIQTNMSDVLLRQPNYTCTETVERTRQPAGSRSGIEDTLRLEVALVEGKEMFAWPGSTQFEDRDLRELVSTGMFGNGNFAIFARILFLTKAPEFGDGHEAMLEGRAAVRYDFQVRRSDSGYHLRVDNRDAVVGFHGSVYADPATLDVRRVEVLADDIPPDLNLLRAETAVDYSRVRIGEEEFLLPVHSESTMASPTVVSRNWLRFVSCRRFTGESTLTFDEPVLDDSAAAHSTPEEVELPAGLTVQLEMPALDLMQAAVGDAIQAVMTADLRSHRQMLAPKGATARGRIVQLDRDRSGFVLRIDFQDLDWPGGHARLKLSFDQAVMVKPVITPGREVGQMLISRQAGPRLSGILMFWRTE